MDGILGVEVSRGGVGDECVDSIALVIMEMNEGHEE